MLKKGVLLVLFVALAGILFQQNKESILKNASKTIGDLSSIKPNKAEGLGVPPYIRDDLYELLRKGQFSELDQTIEHYAKQFDEGKITEIDLNYIIESFSVIDPSLEPHILEWVGTTNSWSSNLSGYRYFDSLSWQWRGNSYYQFVPSLNREKFKKYQSIAKRFLEDAKQNNIRDSIWYSDKINIAKLESNGNIEPLVKEALDKFPKSKSIYYAAIEAQDPRWGGNEFKLQELIYAFSKTVDEHNYEDSEVIYYFRALSAEQDKDYPQALKYITTALERNPDNLSYYSTISRIFNKLNRYEDALRATNTALKYYPLSRVSLTDRANLYIKLAKPELAQKDLTLLLKYSPFHREGNLQNLYLQAALNNKEKFESQLERASFFTKFDPNHWVRLAYNAHYILKDYEVSESIYKKALDIQALDVGANYRLALLYGTMESCDVVEPLYNYFKGCEQRVGRTSKWCKSKDKKWAYSAVNFLKSHQKCPAVNNYDFEHF